MEKTLICISSVGVKFSSGRKRMVLAKRQVRAVVLQQHIIFISRSHSKIWHDAEIMLKSQRPAGQQSPVTIPVYKWHLVIPKFFARPCKKLVIVKIRHGRKHSQST